MKNKAIVTATMLLVTMLMMTSTSCLWAKDAPLKVNSETGESQAQFAARTAWWRQAKFGMFIHWGIYSVPNSDHANTDGMGEWWLYNHKMQVADYEKYATQFDPTKFDAHAWVKTAKDAGMKYIVITSKHHDGFCMFNTKWTNYNVVQATPWHHDPMKDLAAECHKQGIKLCFYYSFMDWHNPDYLPRRPWDTRPSLDASPDSYINYVKGQLTELLTNYGPIGGIWFDGGWEHDAGYEHSLEIVKLIRSLQPGIMINDRLNLTEDYSTPEQSIPAGALPNGRLWETCMTINDHWGYAWNDDHFKSTADLTQKICDIASKGGNFLLNVGPTNEGIIPQPEVDRLEQVGTWMKTNGQCIYGTTQSPFKKASFEGRYTVKGKTLYVEAFQWPADGLTIPGLKTSVRSAYSVADGQNLAVQTASDGTVTISPPTQMDPVATVVALKLAGQPEVEDTQVSVKPSADGSYNLMADDAEIGGESLHIETFDGKDSIGYWVAPKDNVAWQVAAPAGGNYTVSLEYACQPGSDGATFSVATDGSHPSSVTGTVSQTGTWSTFQTMTLPGTLTVSPDTKTITITPVTMPNGAVMNFDKSP